MEPFSAPPGFLLNRLLRSHRKSGPHFLCREKVTKSGRGAPRAPVRGNSLPAGVSARPARCSRRNPGLHWPPGRTRSPYGAILVRGPAAWPATRFAAVPGCLLGPWIGCSLSPQGPPSGRGAACRRQAGGFHFQPEGLAARRLALKDCKVLPTGTPTEGRGKCRHTYFLPSCLAAFAGGT